MAALPLDVALVVVLGSVVEPKSLRLSLGATTELLSDDLWSSKEVLDPAMLVLLALRDVLLPESLSKTLPPAVDLLSPLAKVDFR